MVGEKTEGNWKHKPAEEPRVQAEKKRMKGLIKWEGEVRRERQNKTDRRTNGWIVD